MTRHDLKEQLQHDQFSDSVSKILDYTYRNRQQVIRWSVVALVGLALIGAGIWYSSYRAGQRRADLEAAFEVASAQVGASGDYGKSYPTEDAKHKAELKAFSDVASKDGSSHEGRMALYYLGTLKTQNDPKGAESDLKTVADSSSDVAPLAKIALSQLYSGQNRMADAQSLLRSLVDHPSSLVSKAQAQVMLAQLEQTTNPKDAKKILQSLKADKNDPVVARAADQVAAQMAK